MIETCGSVHKVVMVSVLLVAVLVLSLSELVSAQMFMDADMSDQPFIFVSKTTSSDDIVIGSPVVITSTVYNYGQSPAFDVVIADLLQDNTTRTHTVASLPYGASATLQYEVVPPKLGNYPVGITQVTYNTVQGDNSTRRLAFSNLIRENNAYFRGDTVDDQSFRGMVSVLTRDRYDRLHARFIREFIAYTFLGVIPALFPYMLYRVKQTEVEALLRRAKKSTK